MATGSATAAPLRPPQCSAPCRVHSAQAGAAPDISATASRSVWCQAAHLPRQAGGARAASRRALSSVALETERLCSATPPSSATLSSGRLRVAVDVDEGEAAARRGCGSDGETTPVAT
jgi:hypothetical protein